MLSNWEMANTPQTKPADEIPSERVARAAPMLDVGRAFLSEQTAAANSRDERLAEQRVRHAWYRRYVIREPQIEGFRDNFWEPSGVGSEDLNLEDSHHDGEIRLRDFADELFEANDGACRSAVEQIVAELTTRDLERKLLGTQHPRLAKRLRSDGVAVRDIRHDSDIGEDLRDAMHALYYADLLKEAN